MMGAAKISPLCECGFLFAGSGKFQELADATFEARVYKQLSEKLRRHGAVCVIPEFPARDVDSTVAPEDHILTRVSLLKAADEQLTAQLGSSRAKVWIGFSLGAHCLLRLVSSEIGHALHLTHLLLAGCVLERPVTILAPLRSVHLLYGEMDYVAYCDEAGNMTQPISPNEYADTTCSRLVMRRSQTRTVSIWNECDHLLSDRTPGSVTITADRLFDTIVDTLMEKRDEHSRRTF